MQNKDVILHDATQKLLGLTHVGILHIECTLHLLQMLLL